MLHYLFCFCPLLFLLCYCSCSYTSFSIGLEKNQSSLSLKRKKPSNQVFLNEEKTETPQVQVAEKTRKARKTKKDIKTRKRAQFYLHQPVSYGVPESRTQRNSGQDGLPYRARPKIVYSPFANIQVPAFQYAPQPSFTSTAVTTATTPTNASTAYPTQERLPSPQVLNAFRVSPPTTNSRSPRRGSFSAALKRKLFGGKKNQQQSSTYYPSYYVPQYAPQYIP